MRKFKGTDNMRKGKKDRRATPPMGGDGREHNRRKNKGKY